MRVTAMSSFAHELPARLHKMALISAFSAKSASFAPVTANPSGVRGDRLPRDWRREAYL